MDGYSYGGYSNPFPQQSMYTGRVKAVHGESGAKSVDLAPGASVILPDDCERYVWWISADQYGIKTAIAYPYGDPVTANTHAQNKEETPVYVTTEEFDKLAEKVDKLLEELK